MKVASSAASLNAPPLRKSESRRWIGALYKSTASLGFAAMNGLSKASAKGPYPIPSTEMVFLQNLFSTLCSWPMLPSSSGRLRLRAPIRWHAARVTSAVLGMIAWRMAIDSMPIAQAVALGFTGPIFTILGSIYILDERLTRTSLLAVLLSLAGAFLITRPDLALLAPTATLDGSSIYPLLSAAFFAMTNVFGRKLSLWDEPAVTQTFVLTIFMTPVSLIPALFVWEWPSLWYLVLAFVSGVLATLAHWTTAKSFEYAEVTFLTPFGFIRLLSSAGIGFYLFGEPWPPASALLGFILICASILILSFEGKVKNV